MIDGRGLHLRRRPHAVRPLRRRAAAVRTDDLGAIPLQGADGAQPEVDWAAVDDVIFGCANQAGEDNRNVARMALLLAGLPIERAGRDRQPPVRLGHGCGRHRGARDQGGRGGADDRRRRREHERARRSCMPKAESAFAAPRRDLRHHHRLALRQPADEGAVRRRLDAGDGRERRRATTRSTREEQDAFALRSQQRAARRRQRGRLAKRDRAGDDRRRTRASRSSSRRDEHPRADTTLEALAKLPTPFRAGRHGHRRQRIGRQRRRLRAAGRLRGRGRALRPDAARARGRHGDRRRGAAHHGHRPGAGDAEAAARDRPERSARST